MPTVDVRKLRQRTFHYLSSEVAATADMRLDQLQQFVAGRYRPTDEQLAALAERMRLTDAR